jgi:hypothetical protein
MRAKQARPTKTLLEAVVKPRTTQPDDGVANQVRMLFMYQSIINELVNVVDVCSKPSSGCKGVDLSELSWQCASLDGSQTIIVRSKLDTESSHACRGTHPCSCAVVVRFAAGNCSVAGCKPYASVCQHMQSVLQIPSMLSCPSMQAARRLGCPAVAALCGVLCPG